MRRRYTPRYKFDIPPLLDRPHEFPIIHYTALFYRAITLLLTHRDVTYD